MISISTFKAFPQLPGLAVAEGLKLELCKLVEPVTYPDDFLQTIRKGEYHDHYNSAHGPFRDLIPASSDPEIQARCKVKFLRAVAACKKLGIRNLVLHTGWMKDFYPDDFWIRNSITFWTTLLQEAGSEITIHLENVFEPDVHLMGEILEGVNHANLQACLDVGHLNLTCPNGLEEWIKKLGPRIGHVHLHNNHGVSDEHNGLDNGNLDIPEVLRLLSEHCPKAVWNLEIRNNFEESIRMAKAYRQ